VLGGGPPPIDFGTSPFATPPRDLIPLGTGYMDESLQPLALLRAAVGRAARRDHVFSRVPSEGLEPLRAWFARDIGGELSARNVLIVPGGQAALSAVIRALVPAEGGLLCESPTYFGALAIARASRIRPLPVPSDAEGIRPDLLEAAVARSGARVLYLQPNYANPSGALLSTERRIALLEVVQKLGLFVIEDDYARDLAIDGVVPAPLVRACPGHVVYVRSLTKTAAPGLRVAAIAALGPAFERLRAARAVDEWFVSGLLQETTLELVGATGWRRHTEQLRSKLRERRDAMLEAIDRELSGLSRSSPLGGFSVWLALPPAFDDLELAREAERAGVHLNAGRLFYPAEPDAPHVRLSYAGAEPREIREGVARLAEVLRRR
jgi:DNA-binding transcriptional MocR family regulator